VFCVDEKGQIQAIDRTQPAFPILPGTPARRAHDYIRHGTTSLFAALEVATGKVIGQTHSRHRNEEFRRFLNLIDREVPEHLDVPHLPKGPLQGAIPVLGRVGVLDLVRLDVDRIREQLLPPQRRSIVRLAGCSPSACSHSCLKGRRP
jgi:hypothetical protein